MAARGKRWAQWLCVWLTIVAGVIALTILVSYLLFPLFIRLDNLREISGFSARVLNRNYHQLMAYLQLPWVAPLHMSNFPSSASGAHHFADVKRLFLLDYAVFIVTAPVTWHFLAQLRRTRRRYLLVRPFAIAMPVPLILGGLMAINFNAVFIAFHHVLFRNNDWLFDPAVDPIINVLPEDFFLVCFVIALVVAEALLAWGIHLGRRDAKGV